MNKSDLKREIAATKVVYMVIEDLQAYGLIKEAADGVLGRAITDAAQHIDHLVLIDDENK
jgi:hypothetical protein